MFERLTIRGTTASILWGYRPAAVLRQWTITKSKENRWTLRGQVERTDAFQLRQKPLLFTAPRQHAHDGFWAWGINSVEFVGPHQLVAQLGPPEQ